MLVVHEEKSTDFFYECDYDPQCALSWPNSDTMAYTHANEIHFHICCNFNLFVLGLSFVFFFHLFSVLGRRRQQSAPFCIGTVCCTSSSMWRICRVMLIQRFKKEMTTTKPISKSGKFKVASLFNHKNDWICHELTCWLEFPRFVNIILPFDDKPINWHEFISIMPSSSIELNIFKLFPRLDYWSSTSGCNCIQIYLGQITLTKNRQTFSKKKTHTRQNEDPFISAVTLQHLAQASRPYTSSKEMH